MTQAFNLSQLANNLNSSGQLDATDGLVNAVPVANGGTGASSSSAARGNLGVPANDGTGATGTWGISVSGNAATATTATTATSATSASTATYATTAGNGGVTSVDSATGAVSLASLPAFAKNLAVNGYQKLPGGLIIQWGITGAFSAGNNSQSITFANAFPTAALHIQVTPNINGNTGSFTFSSYNLTTTGVTINNNGGAAATGVYYLVIGY